MPPSISVPHPPSFQRRADHYRIQLKILVDRNHLRLTCDLEFDEQNRIWWATYYLNPGDSKVYLGSCHGISMAIAKEQAARVALEALLPLLSRSA